jgi:hypothetical protein
MKIIFKKLFLDTEKSFLFLLFFISIGLVSFTSRHVFRATQYIEDVFLREILLIVVLLTILWLLRGATYRAYSRPAWMVLRGILILMAVYIALSPPSILISYFDSSLTGARIIYGHWVSLVLLILGLWRPAFAIAGIMIIIWERNTLGAGIGQTISYTEIYPLFEVTFFLIFGHAIYTKLFKNQTSVEQETSDALNVSEKLLLMSIAVHLSGYFYSGIKKIIIADGLFDWVLENPTDSLIYNAIVLGYSPLALLQEEWLSFFLNLMSENIVVFNGIIFLIQLAAILCVQRINFIIWITVLYDISHVGIYFLTGIFFYKWIILNLLIVFALGLVKHKVITKDFKFVLMFTLIFSPILFWVPKLGWWDTQSLNKEIVYAITESGERVNVPSNYFGSFSVIFAQGRLIRNKGDLGLLPTGTFGVGFGQIEMLRLNNHCEIPLLDTQLTNEKIGGVMDSRVIDTIKAVHSFHLQRLERGYEYSEYSYPYHIPAIKQSFREFSAMDLTTIRSFQYCIAPTCSAKLKDIHRINDTHNLVEYCYEF